MDFSTPPNYCARAEKCLELSERAKDGETRVHWLSMAKACLVLAEAWETENPSDVLGGPIHHEISPTRH
jgi:hypothetical protein